MAAQVVDFSDTVVMAHGTGQYPQMLQACNSLASSVQSALALPPIPDIAMESEYLLSLEIFQVEAVACEASITVRPEGDEDVTVVVNQAVIQPIAALFSKGVIDLYKAIDYLAFLPVY